MAVKTALVCTHLGVVERRTGVQRSAPGMAERLVDSHLSPGGTAGHKREIEKQEKQRNPGETKHNTHRLAQR